MASRALDRVAFPAALGATVLALLPLLLQLPPWLGASLLPVAALALAQQLRGRVFSAWLRVPLTLLATLGVIAAFGRIGRDTGAGLLATMLALKLLETRSVRDARLVVSFALFGTVAAFYFDQGPLSMVLAGIALPLALATLAYLAELELPGAIRPATQPAARLRSGLRLLALSLPLALAAFFLFPRLASPLWGLPGNNQQARTGVSDSMSPGDMTELFADDSPILRVQFQGRQPQPSSLYWRGPVLWHFDGRSWERARWIEAARPAAMEAEGPLLRYQLTQEPTERRYVFALDLATAAPEGLLLNADRTLLAPRPLSGLGRFDLTSAPAYRLEPSLPPSLREQALRLPDDFNPRARDLALSWRSEDASPEAIARRALALFRREFTYSLSPPLLGRDSVDDFLFNTREGYCEHFASAFAFLMRAAGVPARIVLGYHGGWYNATGDYWLVANSDAHAWTEIWIEGRGWTRVDPTAAVAPERIESGSGSALAERGMLADFLRGLAQRSDLVRRLWNEVLLGFDARRQQSMLQSVGLDARDWRVMGAAFALTAILAVLITLVLVLRQGLTNGDPLPRAWRRLRRRLHRAGLPPQPGEGPLRLSQRAARHFPASARQLEGLSRRYIAWRYAGAQLDAEEQAQLARALRRFRPKRSTPRMPT